MIYFWKHIRYGEVEVTKGYKKKEDCRSKKAEKKKAVMKTENEIA